MNDIQMQPKPALQFSRREFVIGAVLAGASGVSYAALPKVTYPRVNDSAFESWIPGKFSSWSLESPSGVVLPPPDALKDRLYDNLATRGYRSPNAPAVMLLIAYNYKQDGVLQLHRPEFCYPAGGYTLSASKSVNLRLGNREIPARAFTAVGVERTEQVLYFTRLGEIFPQTWVDQRISVMWANLKGQIPDGALMRVSVVGGDQVYALEVLSSFLAAFFTGARAPLRHLLIRAD